MRLVFAGTPQVAVPSLQALLDSRHDVVGVITRPDAPTGRGRKLTASPVSDLASEAGIPVVKPAKPSEPEFVAWLTQLAPDAVPVVAYGALIPQPVLDIPRLGWVNLHFSLLPRWRGAAPVQHALMAGDAQTGTTAFRLVKAMDAGPIIRQSVTEIGEQTAGELLARLADSGAGQLLDALDALEAGEEPTPQTEDGVTLAPKVTVETARLDFTQDAATLHHLVMGCSPDPGAWCELDGQRFKIYRSRIAEPRALAPGELEATKRELFVGTGDGTLELVEVQAPGKKRMAGADWARGGVGSLTLS